MSATSLTPEAREKLQDRLSALNEQSTAIQEAMKPFEEKVKPFRDALTAIEAAKDALLDDAGVEVAGNCENCDLILFDGDLGHRCSDGPILCASCSPTYKDLLNQYSEPGAAEAAEDAEGFADGLAAAQGEVNAGNGDKPCVAPL